MTELDRITEIAKSVNAELSYEITLSKGKELCLIYFTPEELLAFEQVIIAKRDESYLALQEEVDALNGALILSANKVKKLEAETGVRKFCEVQAVQLSKAHREEIDHLKAQLAMQAEAIEKIKCDPAFDSMEQEVIDATYKALNATSEDVARYKAEIEKSVLEESDKRYKQLVIRFDELSRAYCRVMDTAANNRWLDNMDDEARADFMRGGVR